MIRFSSLGGSLKRGLAIAAGLLVIPLTAAQLPSVYSNTSDSENLTYSSIPAPLDTTYDDGTFVILKTAACMGGVCYVDPPYPSQFTLRWKPDYSAILLFTYETGIGTALDSIAVDSIWVDWGYSDPQAYAVAVPGSGSSELADLGITPAESTMIAEILGFPYKGHPIDYGDGWDWLVAYDSSFEWWSDYHYADFQAGAAANDLNAIYFHYYYDRAKTHYNYWWRNGEVQWKRVGDSLANEIFRIYYEPNNCIMAPRRYFPEGMWVRYASGSMVETTISDSSYRDCIGRWADYLWRTWGDNMTTTQWDDTRGQSRTVLGVMYGALYDTTDTYPFDSLVDNRIALDNLIEMHEFKAGGWDGDHTPAGVGKMRTQAYCWGASAFQTAANVLYTMIMWQERIDTTRIDTVRAITEGALDTISAYWNPTGNFISGREMWATDYVMDPDSTGCSTDPANGLNMLMSTPYAWYFNQTGDSAYWHWYDTLTDYGLLQQPNWIYNDGKEYNESYHQTTLGLKWLEEGS